MSEYIGFFIRLVVEPDEKIRIGMYYGSYGNTGSGVFKRGIQNI